MGCLDEKCVLCEHNPKRRCSVNFCGKYLVNDPLRARCGAQIRLELVDGEGKVFTGAIPGLKLEICVLDGNSYVSSCYSSREDEREKLEKSMLLSNKRGHALLVPLAGTDAFRPSPVTIPVENGTATLPDLQITDSSEALLPGRKPPFRIFVEAVMDPSVRDLYRIHPAISEPIVVATRRTRSSGKADIPYIDDHVSKLDHMGKETVRKFADLKNSAKSMGIPLDLPTLKIETVGDFKSLVLLADMDQSLRNKLQQILKLSKEKWNEAREHAMKAVFPDNRLRIWYPDVRDGSFGILFPCRLGCTNISKPVGVLSRIGSGESAKDVATSIVNLSPTEQQRLHSYSAQMVSSWWVAGHPGWGVYPADTDSFVDKGIIDHVQNLVTRNMASRQSHGSLSELSDGSQKPPVVSPPAHFDQRNMAPATEGSNHAPKTSCYLEIPSAFANFSDFSPGQKRQAVNRENAAPPHDQLRDVEGARLGSLSGFPSLPISAIANDDLESFLNQYTDTGGRLQSWAVHRLASMDFRGKEDVQSQVSKILEGMERVPSGLENMQSIEESLPDDLVRAGHVQ